jgi:archaellum component FlaG (FlaF/FlaG flagellin family)
VTFTFLVENIGQEDVTLTSLGDTVFGSLDGKGTCSVPQTILVGGSYSCAYTVFLSSDSLTAHYDVATATAEDDEGTPATDDDDATVTFSDVAPAIRITKTANPTSVPETGGDVTFTFLVENIGTEDVTLTSLSDTVFGTLDGGADCKVGTVLAAGASCDFSITQFIAGDFESGIPHENTASVIAVDNDGNGDTDSDGATVTFTDVDQVIDINKLTNGADGLDILAGKLVTWTYTVTNHSTVILSNITVTDDQGVIVSCPKTTLSVEESMTCTASGTAAAGQYNNTGTATGSFTDGAGNIESDTATDVSSYFGAAPSFTVSKNCKADTEPVPQEGPALFTVTFSNDGNVELSVTADDGIGTFGLAVGETKSFDVTLAGPFSGFATADNTVNGSATYTDDAGTPTTIEHEASGSCRVGSRDNVLKWTQGAVDPTQTWTFGIWDGVDGFGGTQLASSNTSGDLDGVLEFGNYNLDSLQAYTLCEESVPAGWTSFWQVDTNNDGVADTTVIPYNPNFSDSPPQDLGNRCVDFGAGTGVDLLADGGTLFFQVNNTYPGGEPRTPGYWKNWNRCTGGGQAENADRNGGWQEGFWLLEDVLDPDIGGGITWFGQYSITTCEQAVSILDQRDTATGQKMSSDAAYTLAMHLLAAQLNFAAGAEK